MKSERNGERLNGDRLKELLLQALETEMGGVEIYRTALHCASNDDLREEWEKYLEQTEEHVKIVRGLCDRFDVDAEEESPGRLGVRRIGETLVQVMRSALDEGDEESAEIVATECVVLAETKDHLDWELIGELSKKTKGDEGKALKAAHKEVETQEDEHLYHTQGWCRELWCSSLGLKAVLPPPEEQKDVRSAVGAAKAKKSRSRMARAKTASRA
jgi:hypothetical protein